MSLDPIDRLLGRRVFWLLDRLFNRAARRVRVANAPEGGCPCQPFPLLLFCEDGPFKEGRCSAFGVPHIHTEFGPFMVYTDEWRRSDEAEAEMIRRYDANVRNTEGAP